MLAQIFYPLQHRKRKIELNLIFLHACLWSGCKLIRRSDLAHWCPLVYCLSNLSCRTDRVLYRGGSIGNPIKSFCVSCDRYWFSSKSFWPARSLSLHCVRIAFVFRIRMRFLLCVLFVRRTLYVRFLSVSQIPIKLFLILVFSFHERVDFCTDK